MFKLVIIYMRRLFMGINSRKHVNLLKKVKTKQSMPNYKYDENIAFKFNNKILNSIRKLESKKELEKRKHDYFKTITKTRIKELLKSSKTLTKEQLKDKQLKLFKKMLLENKVKVNLLEFSINLTKITQIIYNKTRDLNVEQLFAKANILLMSKEEQYFKNKSNALIFHNQVINEIRKKLEASENVTDIILDFYNLVEKY